MVDPSHGGLVLLDQALALNQISVLVVRADDGLLHLDPSLLIVDIPEELLHSQKALRSNRNAHL